MAAGADETTSGGCNNIIIAFHVIIAVKPGLTSISCYLNTNVKANAPVIQLVTS